MHFSVGARAAGEDQRIPAKHSVCLNQSPFLIFCIHSRLLATFQTRLKGIWNCSLSLAQQMHGIAHFYLRYHVKYTVQF